MIYGDWETFFLDNDSRLYHFAVYKRMFTPYEQVNCFSDESQYEQDIWRYGFIREVVPLPDGDLLLGIQEVYDEIADDPNDDFEYYKLSEIRLAYKKDDIKMFTEDYCETEES